MTLNIMARGQGKSFHGTIVFRLSAN